MALVLADRVRDTTTTTGTGTVTLSGTAPTGYQNFSVVGNGNTTYYTINADSQWEVGIGTYSSTGPTLSRNTVLASSNGGALVNFAAGIKDVFITYPAEKAVTDDYGIALAATTATNIAGGAAGSIPYQTAANTTALLAAGTGVLIGGTTPSYTMSPSLTQVTVAADPTTNLQVATKQYVDTIAASGVTYHTPVKYEAPTPLTATYNNGSSGVGATLTNAGTLAAFAPDGVVASVNDRILIYTQADPVQNGVYTVTTVGSGSVAWVLTRATDANTYGLKSPNALGEGDAFFVTSGNTGAGETYVCNTSGTITFGTTPITFVQVSSAQVYSAGTGLTLTGTVFSLTAPVATTLGGTGLTSFTSGGAVYATSSSTLTTGTLPATSGGTGLSSYTAGDLLYATSSTTVGTLADVATGNALLSGGVGADPAWGKVGLTTHVTGTLPVANGGTGATSLTGYLVGNGTSAFTATATIPTSALSGTISLTTQVSGTLGAGNGGTGLSSYTVGDLLYASGTTTLASLPDVATGNALISGGVSNAPLWGKIGLTTHVSGTLPVSNGGSGATTLTGYLKGNGTSAFTASATIPAGDITGAALTKADDTNVTLTLGGSPSTALLAATSITAGWTGQLAVSRGGTGNSTLASGYLIKGNGVSPTSASVIYDDGTNVGIGTSSPASKLDVNGVLTTGNITVRGDGVEGGQITFNNLGNTAGPLTLDVDGSGNGRLFTTVNNANLTIGQLVGTGGVVTFATSGSERMRVDTGGNVNIGAQAATAAGNLRYLDIYNTENTNGSSGADIRLITQNAAGSGLTTLDLIKYKSGAFYIANAETGSGGIIGFSTSSTERMRITAAGLVGIGTSTPSFLLHGVQNGNAEFRVSATNVGTNSAGLTVENEGNRNWNLWANRSTDNFIIGANSRANDFIAINGSTGNVGIGTSAPASLLHVKRGSNAIEVYPAGTWATRVINATDGSGENGLLVGNRWAGTGSTVFEVGSIFGGGTGSWYSYYRIDGTGQSIWSNSGTERMRLDTSGNLGIGTSSPGARLDVRPAANNIMQVKSASHSTLTGLAAASTYSRGNDGIADLAAVFGWNNGGLAMAGREGLAFATGGATSYSDTVERMRVTAAGRVGVNTSNPLSFLGVGSATGQVGFNIGTSSSPERGNLWYDTDGTGWKFNIGKFQSSTFTAQMTFQDNGNVGIGTSSPSERLDTGSGNTRTQALVISGDQHLLYSVSSTELGIRIGTGGPFYGIGTTGSSNMRLNSASGGDMLFAIAATEYMRISNTTGNVRIGSGATNVSALSISRSSATATVAASSSIVLSNRNTSINGTIAGGIFIDTYRDVADPHYSGGIWFTRNQEVSNLSSSSAIVFGTMISGGSGLPTERMRLDSAGNLSIGNTSGNARLRVSGAASVNAPVLGNVGNYPIFISNADVGYGLGIGTNASDGHVWLQAQRSDSAVAYNITLNEAGGNVGIGTSSPSARLDVRSGAGADSQIANRAGNAAYMVLQGTSFPNFNQVQSFDGSGNLYWSIGGSGTANTLAFLTNGSNERARINEFGQFLIGTTSGGRTVCINAADNWIRQSNPSRSWLIGPANGSDYNIYDETAGTNRFRIDTSGTWNGPNSILLGSGQNNDNKIEIGTGRTGNNYAYIDLIGDTTYTDFGLRLLRGNGGPNTFSQLSHRGTGDFSIVNVEGAALTFGTSNSERFRVEATGAVSFSANSLIVGRNSASTDVNTANDTGSISIRGSTTTVAVMSFHRAGAYAINMGLGTDAVFRIGGWSASSNCFQMDGSGNLTMLGNVTAYSDARMKKDVETIGGALDLVSKMRGVRYTRTDTDKRGVGVIAQEMLEVVPEVVQQGVGDDDTLSVAYGNLVGVLIEAIKELTARVAELEGK